MAPSGIDKKKLVSDLCNRSKATFLLEEFFKHPKDPAFGKSFAKALNESILKEQHKIKDTKNLLLPMNRVRYIFASYINNCDIERHMSEAIRTLHKSGGSRSTQEAYQKIQGSAQEEQLRFRHEWDSLIDDKGYPSSWKTMFVEHAESLINAGPPSFDPSFLEDLRQKIMGELVVNVRMRYRVWGDISFADDREAGVTSWNYEWALNPGGLFSKEGSGAGGVRS
jgi:hypothetical protein